MNSNNINIKYLRSLQQKKFRDEDNVFVAEGIKTVSDIISLGNTPVVLLYDKGNDALPQIITKNGIEVPYSTIERVSGLKTPQQVFAVFRKFITPDTDQLFLHTSPIKILFLDGISDPGNFGTIVRTADWFGFDTIVCSHNTVDMYNPKVIQATMGAVANVKIHYVDPVHFLTTAKKHGYSVVGTFMDGENIQNFNFPQKSIIVIGNEGNGISHHVKTLTDKHITILPGNSTFHHKKSESLNAAIANAIVLFALSSTK